MTGTAAQQSRSDEGILGKIQSAYQSFQFQDGQFENLDAHGRALFFQLLAEYQSLSPTLPPDDAGQLISDWIKQKPKSPTWDDLYFLEKTLLRTLPDTYVRRHVWRLRSQFRAISGNRLYADYQSSSPPDADTGDIERVRADAQSLQSGLHRLYSAYAAGEIIRMYFCRHLFLAFLCSSFFLACAYVIAWKWGTETVQHSLFIPYAGTAGAFFSALIRAQRFPTGPKIYGILNSVLRSKWSVILSPYISLLEGAIGASIFYLLWRGGILGSKLFPSEDFVQETDSFCRLMVWSFIAGFSERLIPDVLDRVSTKVRERSPKAEEVV